MPYYIKKKDTSKTARTSASSLRDRLDREFSKFIRLRDAMTGGTFRCIACGMIKPISKADCGHFHSRMHMGTRWDEDNCHAECSSCNRFSADHLIGYRENLIRKIGAQRFALLEIKARDTKKWTSFELKQLIKYYRQQNSRLSKEKSLTL